jgi:type II secretory ATPase GspE/PulE/Tfp pilus assembly ATPase PilB-like protein
MSAPTCHTKGLEEFRRSTTAATSRSSRSFEISAEALAKKGEAACRPAVNVVLMSAIQKGASDIHIEPRRIADQDRIDGSYNIMNPPMKFRDATHRA